MEFVMKSKFLSVGICALMFALAASAHETKNPPPKEQTPASPTGGAGGAGGTGVGVGIGIAAANASSKATAGAAASVKNSTRVTNTATAGAGGSSTSTNTVTQGSVKGGDVTQRAGDVAVTIEGAAPGSGSINYSPESARPVSSATAPALAAGGVSCAQSTSAGVQGANFGLSFGTTREDVPCDTRADIATLIGMGMPDAALARACAAPNMKAAIEASGRVCPAPKTAAASAPVSTTVASASTDQYIAMSGRRWPSGSADK